MSKLLKKKGKKVVKKEKVVVEATEAFDPDLPLNKQRHLDPSRQ